MREVRKSIYNVSRPDHFGSIKKTPFDVGQYRDEREANLQQATKEQIDSFMESLDDPLKLEIDSDPMGDYFTVQTKFPIDKLISLVQRSYGYKEMDEAIEHIEKIISQAYKAEQEDWLIQIDDTNNQVIFER